jgi:uncharacterized protein
MTNKVIKDLVHGYIIIDNNICKIIDHISFQRLKGISQLTAHHLYPSANHTRFEHSLGVMHLAIIFFEQLLPQIKEMKSTSENAEIEERMIYLKENLRYAALLHDVGHAPYSHLGESFYDKNEIITKIEEFNLTSINGTTNGSNHELMSCYIILKNFQCLLDQIKNSGIPIDYDFIYRIITGTKYIKKEDWDKNLIIEIVNSSMLDVDKLDYLIRDNFMTGYVAPVIDIKRLVFSLTISGKKLSFSPSGISSLISFKDSRDFLYLWIYNHHTVVYTDFLYKTAITHLLNNNNEKTSQEIKQGINKLFSTEAIAENYASDHDVNHFLYKEFVITKETPKNEHSEYSEEILSQLLERNFLKPMWKTILEYRLFIEDNFDGQQIDQIEEDILSSEQNIKKIVQILVAKTNAKFGQIFIIPRSNKFYSGKKNKFYINYPDKGARELDRLVPSRKFNERYSEIAFYIFTRPELTDKVKIAFLEIVKNEEYKK